MKPVSVDAKKAYFAKVRRSNYAASLRLEGYSSQPSDTDRRLSSRETVLSQYRARVQ